jgi:hypothetical protein
MCGKRIKWGCCRKSHVTSRKVTSALDKSAEIGAQQELFTL